MKTKLKLYNSSIPQEDIIPVLNKLEKWCNTFHETSYRIGYYTRTSIKIISFHLKMDHWEKIDGYMLIGLIMRMSEMNMSLKEIKPAEVYEELSERVENEYIIKFEGSSLGKYYNPIFNIYNNIGGNRSFPPKITEEK